MFEVYYGQPIHPAQEATLTERIQSLGGRLDFREEPSTNEPGAIVLTYEFDDFDTASHAAEVCRQQGFHIEGPYDYGP